MSLVGVGGGSPRPHAGRDGRRAANGPRTGASHASPIVGTDQITEALRQTVVYLNDHLDAAVVALELAYLRDGEVEMLVPAIYGEESAERKKPTRRPTVADADTVVVAARVAYQAYLDTSAYVCQPLRSFRKGIQYLGFYKDKAIQREVPVIRHRRKDVTFSRDVADGLRNSGDETDVEIGELVAQHLAASQDEGESRQVFLLSPPDDALTLVLSGVIHHTKRGAWTQGQRYTRTEALKRGPATTEELVAEGG